MRLVPSWRPFTWFIVVVNVVFLIWIISGLAATGNNCEGVARADLETCEAATAVGAGIGVGIIVFLWALVDIILGIIWLVTGRRRRDCPVCGSDVKKGVTTCKKCGYDFRTGTAPTRA